MNPFADIVLTNAEVVTFDEKDARGEAVAIKGDLILGVGKNREIISEFAGPDSKIIDLHGRLLTPGLIDSHIHVASAGPYDKFALRFNYPVIQSIADIVVALKQRITESSENEWVKGVGWDEARLREKRYITRWDLDPVSSNNPVVLTHTSGHFAVVNSVALKIAGINRDTPQPNGGTIEKDEITGEPTGILKELAVNLVKVPLWTERQLEEGIKYLSEQLVKVGITSIKDGCYLEGFQGDVVSAYSSLANRGELKVRAYLLGRAMSIEDLDVMKGLSSYQVGDRFKLGGIKIFMDGSLMGRTAWCYDEFLNPEKEGGVDQGNRGYPLIAVEEFSKIVREARKRGYQVCTHAIGDRAIDAVLDEYEKNSDKPENYCYTVIHSMLATTDAIKRMKRLGVCVETQSSFLYFLSAAYARSIASSKMLRLTPLRSLLDEGVIVGNGSDYFVAPFAPAYGIWAACSRESIAGDEISGYLGKGQCISVHEALRTYTAMAAKCLRLSEKIGSIEKGKLADLVVWADNLYQVPIERIKEAKVALTVVGGKVVYDDLISRESGE